MWKIKKKIELRNMVMYSIVGIIGVICLLIGLAFHSHDNFSLFSRPILSCCVGMIMLMVFLTYLYRRVNKYSRKEWKLETGMNWWGHDYENDRIVFKINGGTLWKYWDRNQSIQKYQWLLYYFWVYQFWQIFFLTYRFGWVEYVGLF